MIKSKFIDYIQLEKNYSKHTVKSYSKDLLDFENFIKKDDFASKLKDVNFQIIRSWIIELSKSKISNRSINRKISSLKSFYKYLIKIGEIQENPTDKISLIKQSKTVYNVYSKKEMKSLFSKNLFANDFEGFRDLLMLKLLYYTGIRKSEIISIRLIDIDFFANSIKVLGKRNKERIVFFSDEISLDIDNYLDKRDVLNSEEDYLFLSKKAKKMYPKLVFNVVNHYIALVTVKQKKSPHMMRHTFASHMLDEGANISSIKDLLGHSSIAATEVYTHSSMSKIKDIHKKFHPRGED